MEIVDLAYYENDPDAPFVRALSAWMGGTGTEAEVRNAIADAVAHPETAWRPGTLFRREPDPAEEAAMLARALGADVRRLDPERVQ